MVEIGNNIKVLLTKYSKDVIIDDIGGELLLYNNTQLCGLTDFITVDLLKDFSFTGVGLEFNDKVINMEVKDFYSNSLEFVVHLDYIFVKKQEGNDLSDPMCVVSFVPKHPVFAGAQFYAHFLEKTN